MPLERRDVERALLKKGFQSKEGNHHFFTYVTLSGKKSTVYTKTSHGTGHSTLPDNLVSAMSGQCGLTNNQFKQLVACPLTQIHLEKILLETGRIKLG